MYLIITRNFPPEVGGMQNLMWGLTNSLSKLNMVKVFADYHENHIEFDKKVSFSIERVKGPKILRKYRKSFLINDFIKQNTKINCLIADHWKSLENINTNKKKICLIHSKEINHKKGSWLNKRVLNVLNNIEYVVANSNFTKNLAIDLGVLSEKIIVINPGIDPVYKVPQDLMKKAEDIFGAKKNRLITVSRFDKRKNHEKVIMALRNLKEIYPDIIYLCIGYGDEEENIKKLVEQLNLGNQVIFLKNISNDLKNALVASSNIFIMPSIIDKKSIEGFGIAFVEAAQFGVPSIGGKDGGASDAIIHEKTGLICDGNSLEDISASVDTLLKDRKYKEYGKLAKENSKNFYWDKIIENYKRIL
ncbi:MAG: glycosyltransferase family 4 protein [Candidatus Pelagibacter sp.]|jgi:phosphatidylinositol alpha-1,6-mannosyltransferase|tara:strand:- start:427 stop:1509 length:1083 start_codon:yes stop_codon:yes gene_type:complete